MPKIPDPWLPKLPTAEPVPVKIPFVTSNLVAPEAASAPLPVPDALPPAEPKKLADMAEPLPVFVALPPLDPTPEPVVAVLPFRVPVVVLPMLRAPLLVPKPPVGPVETGVTAVVKVEWKILLSCYFFNSIGSARDFGCHRVEPDGAEASSKASRTRRSSGSSKTKGSKSSKRDANVSTLRALQQLFHLPCRTWYR